ncbi:hypothetical protein [Corynebacterium xerosis]|uniref:Uncharacterized protein n=1 Tax=Corynebacterium xerosis TaxID=1725 RepID=A0A7X9XU78_9CORY|nr:hypothetical protein [Corynebacterium xerosis]NMF10130.1 hypothetical protein [Corynebacterium xerosis]
MTGAVTPLRPNAGGALGDVGTEDAGAAGDAIGAGEDVGAAGACGAVGAAGAAGMPQPPRP